MKPKYKRVMLKLSGEVFAGRGKIIDFDDLEVIAKEVAAISKLGVEVLIVNGGGNIWRFRDHQDSGLDRVSSDTVGMMATVINSVALKSALEKQKIKTVVCSEIHVAQLTEPYVQRTALEFLQKGYVVICSGGTGNPFFTTDSAAALRALELSAELLLKATKVDYVYDRDPVKDKKAKRFSRISYDEVLKQNLKVIDATCVSLCRDGGLPIRVFNLEKAGNMKKVIEGENIGTLIS